MADTQKRQFYKTRLDQLRALEREFKNGELTISKLIREASLIGACAERDRTLTLVGPDIQAAITAQGVTRVIGYPS